APRVVRAGEGRVVGRVLAGEVGDGRVLHGEGGTGVGGVERHRVRPVQRRGTGTVHHVFLSPQHLAGQRVDVDGQAARAVGTSTVHCGLPGEPGGGAERGDHQAGAFGLRDGTQ